MKSKGYLIAFVFLILTASTKAQQFTYTFLNPSFGGNSFNASWMMQQAEAQNKHKARGTVEDRYSRNALEDFEESLNRQILSELSRDIIRNAFGEESFSEEGHYEVGNYVIDITNGDNGVIIGIKDFSTGGETTIEVPYY